MCMDLVSCREWQGAACPTIKLLTVSCGIGYLQDVRSIEGAKLRMHPQ